MKKFLPNALGYAFLLALGACCIGFQSTATADTVTVYIQDYDYDPDPVTINVNDTVNWIWQGDYHSTTSVDYDNNYNPLWDSGVYNTGYSYSYTFTSPGSFPYYCTIHYFYGTINVQAPSVPPTVAITNPASGIVLSAPATITLSATASDADGSAASVQFFQGTTALATETAGPYSEVISNLPVGTYSFSAVATDDNSDMATNTITLSVVAPVAITLSVPTRASSTSFQFSYSAAVGLNYAVDRATVLPNWTPLSTNTAATPLVLVQDNGATGGAFYYRVRQIPNP